MLTLEVRYEIDRVKVRKFGNGDLNRWNVLLPGEMDHLTGWSFEDLQRLGEGIWEFPETTRSSLRSPAIAAA